MRTLNMKGKEKCLKGSLVVKPNYNNAYVILKNPLSNFPFLYPSLATAVHEDNKNNKKKMMAMQCWLVWIWRNNMLV